MSGAEPPSWSTWREALGVIATPHHLRRTVVIALVVGTILFCINQLDVVMRGDATATVWVKTVVTYLVPFCVSNAGVLVASRRGPASDLIEGDQETAGEPDHTGVPPVGPVGTETRA